MELMDEFEGIQFVKRVTDEGFTDRLLEGRIEKGLLDNIELLANLMNFKPMLAKRLMREIKRRIKTGKPDVQIISLEFLEGVMIKSPVAHKCFDAALQRSLTKISGSLNTSSHVKYAIISLISRYLDNKLVFPGSNRNVAQGTPHSSGRYLTGWTLKKDRQGRYFFEHTTGQVTYWEKRKGNNGREYFINHKDKTTQWTDPFKPKAQSQPNLNTRSQPNSNTSSNSNKVNVTNVESVVNYIEELLLSEEANPDKMTRDMIKMLITEVKGVENDIQESIVKETNDAQLNRYLRLNDRIQVITKKWTQLQNRPAPPIGNKPAPRIENMIDFEDFPNNNNTSVNRSQPSRNPLIYPMYPLHTPSRNSAPPVYPKQKEPANATPFNPFSSQEENPPYNPFLSNPTEPNNPFHSQPPQSSQPSYPFSHPPYMSQSSQPPFMSQSSQPPFMSQSSQPPFMSQPFDFYGHSSLNSQDPFDGISPPSYTDLPSFNPEHVGSLNHTPSAPPPDY